MDSKERGEEGREGAEEGRRRQEEEGEDPCPCTPGHIRKSDVVTSLTGGREGCEEAQEGEKEGEESSEGRAVSHTWSGLESVYC